VTAPPLSGVASVTLTSAPCGNCLVRPLAITSPALTAGLPLPFAVSVALPVFAL